ncbi:MAG: formylglycine-generating enzyme family protein [Polyangiaceae bacterium]|nr:formylglycine-generating enzyme family protein [Polyangiaceae bacterium]
MKRAKALSLSLAGGMLLVLLAPSATTLALADNAAGLMHGGKSPSSKFAVPTNRGAIDETQTVVNVATTAVSISVGPASDITHTGPTASPELAQSVCPEGMVEVEGDYCPSVEQKCLRWLDPETTTPRRCAEYAETGTCQTATAKKHFCIDRFEYPNKAGEIPVVMKTWHEAASTCKAQGKRLCTGGEWTLACEGQERLPYPYGYARNSDACNIDKPHPDVDEKALANPTTRDAELQRLWQGEASGSRESCVSPFGAFDMTGNVDEWVVNESAKPYKSGLKGGYWGPVRDRCRSMTTGHNEDFAFYQIGFRCCSDGNVGDTAKPAEPALSHAGRAPSVNPVPPGS